MIQKGLYRRYGTSMRGMMTEHGVHAREQPLGLCAAGDRYAAGRPGRWARQSQTTGRLILTNGSTSRAGAVLDRLGISHHSKTVSTASPPMLEADQGTTAYNKFLRVHRIDPSAIFEVSRVDLVVSVGSGVPTTRCWWSSGAPGSGGELGAGRPRRSIMITSRMIDRVFGEGGRLISIVPASK